MKKKKNFMDVMRAAKKQQEYFIVSSLSWVLTQHTSALKSLHILPPVPLLPVD